MILSRPMKAPVKMNKILEVSIMMDSLPFPPVWLKLPGAGELGRPGGMLLGGFLRSLVVMVRLVPSMIFRSAC